MKTGKWLTWSCSWEVSEFLNLVTLSRVVLWVLQSSNRLPRSVKASTDHLNLLSGVRSPIWSLSSTRPAHFHNLFASFFLKHLRSSFSFLLFYKPSSWWISYFGLWEAKKKKKKYKKRWNEELVVWKDSQSIDELVDVNRSRRFVWWVGIYSDSFLNYISIGDVSDLVLLKHGSVFAEKQ